MTLRRVSRRGALKLGAVVGTTSSLAGCSDLLGSDQTNLRYSHPTAASSPPGLFAEGLAGRVEERTDGAVTIDVFHASELGSIPEMVEGTSAGSIAMGSNAFAALGGLYEEILALEIPGMYRNYEHCLQATDPSTSDVMAELNESLIEKADIRCLSSFIVGDRHVTLNEKACVVDDMEGKSIRAPPIPLWNLMVESWGATPTQVDFAELATALSTGSVDGQENPLTIIHSSGLHEAQSHIMLTGHKITINPTYINEGIFQDLTDEQQDILIKAAREQRLATLSDLRERESELVNELRDDPDTDVIDNRGCLEPDPFGTLATDKVLEEFPDWKEYVERISDL